MLQKDKEIFSADFLSHERGKPVRCCPAGGLEQPVREEMYPFNKTGDIRNWNGGNGVSGHALGLLEPPDPIGVAPPDPLSSQPEPTLYESAVISHAHVTLHQPLPVAVSYKKVFRGPLPKLRAEPLARAHLGLRPGS